MKKFGMIVLAAALAFAMVGTAVAADVGGGFSAGASIYTKGRMDQFDVTGDADAAMYLINRGRFTFGYEASDYKAVLQFEIGDTTWDSGAEDAQIVEVKHLYVTGPVGPISLTAGLQALSLGNKIVYADDDYALKGVYAIPTGGALVVAYVKEDEGATTSDPADDVTALVVIYSGEASGYKFDPFLAYYMVDEGAGDGSVIAIGIPVAGPAGPLSVAAELDFITGSLAGPDIDLSGIAFWAKGTYPLAQANAFFELGYGTGDDPGTADKDEGLLNTTANNDFGYDIVLEDAILKDGLNDKMFVKIGGEYMQSEQLTLSGAFIYNMATQKDNWGDETAIGTELDLIATYKATDSATLEAKLGYLMPGAALENRLGDNGAIYRAQWSLTFNF